MRQQIIQFIALGGAIFVLLVGMIMPAKLQARETSFRPALGEVVWSSAGMERVVVTEAGALQVMDQTGVRLPGFPLFIPDEVIVASPVLADLAGDTVKEIVVVTRNSANQYQLRSYFGDGTLVGSVSVTGTVYYDPVAFSTNQKDEILLATTEGKQFQVRWINNAISVSQIVDVGVPSAFSVDQARREVYVSFPNRWKVWVYIRNNNTGRWGMIRSLSVAHPVVFPIALGSAGMYGINRSGQLLGMSTSSGAMLSGFPVTFFSSAIDSPVIADMDNVNPGLELVVPLANGKEAVVSLRGAILSEGGGGQSLSDRSRGVWDSLEDGIFSPYGPYGDEMTKMVQPRRKKIVSLFGRSRYRSAEPTAIPRSTFNSLTVDKSVVRADNTDVQTAQLIINSRNPAAVDDVRFLVNYRDNSNPDNPNRGYFSWKARYGFFESILSGFGNEYVTLLNSGPNTSERIVDESAGTVTFVFRWILAPNYGNIQNNDIAYRFYETANKYFVGYANVDTNFDVSF